MLKRTNIFLKIIAIALLAFIVTNEGFLISDNHLYVNYLETEFEEELELNSSLQNELQATIKNSKSGGDGLAGTISKDLNQIIILNSETNSNHPLKAPQAKHTLAFYIRYCSLIYYA